RRHILSYRGIKDSITDTIRLIGTLKLWKPIIATLANPATAGHWSANLSRTAPDPDARLGSLFCINDRLIDPSTLPWPVGSFIRRLSPALLCALELVYANDGEPIEKKLAHALRIVLRGMKLTDFLFLPLLSVALFLIALGTALWDAFRVYALKMPLEKLLADPVMAYGELQRKARDLDAIRPEGNLE